jgi:hypothetical protein
MKKIVITNNKISKENFQNEYDVVFIEGTLLDVMHAARDMIHKGHRLLTHPLAGSIKPNQTPFKTIVLTLKPEPEVDLASLEYIENSMETSERLLRSRPLRDWPETVLKDYRLIDYDLIKNALSMNKE